MAMVRSMRRGRLFGLFALLVLFVLLQACEYVRPIPNAPLNQWDPAAGYRFRNLMPPDSANTDGLLIVAAFSGGGTRASTLAFGVLRELASQQITWEGKQKRLLDELDVITALSGGTFTAGYYALRGDQIFHDFEARFLRKNWESELKARIIKTPSNWIRLWSPYFGRAHLLAEILDESLFEGATYGDLLKRNERPWLLIHASDMATLSRFEFHQTTIRHDLFRSEPPANRLGLRLLCGSASGAESHQPEELCRTVRLSDATMADGREKEGQDWRTTTWRSTSE